MTPNGAIVFGVVVIVAAMLTGMRGLAVLYSATVLFALFEVGANTVPAVRRAFIVMLPLAAFMLLVWVGFVGRSPAEIAAQMPGTRFAALTYVATVCARLFLIVLVLQLAVLCFADETPLAIIRRMKLPFGIKRLLVLTLSLIETLRHSIDRSYTALVAAGIVTRRVSLRNVRNGWILVQSVWLTAITAVTGRLRDKWPIEDTLSLLRPAIAAGGERISIRDVLWILFAFGAVAAALSVGWYGAA